MTKQLCPLPNEPACSSYVEIPKRKGKSRKPPNLPLARGTSKGMEMSNVFKDPPTSPQQRATNADLWIVVPWVFVSHSRYIISVSIISIDSFQSTNLCGVRQSGDEFQPLNAANSPLCLHLHNSWVQLGPRCGQRATPLNRKQPTRTESNLFSSQDCRLFSQCFECLSCVSSREEFKRFKVNQTLTTLELSSVHVTTLRQSKTQCDTSQSRHLFVSRATVQTLAQILDPIAGECEI